jgi:hypothetical protein
MMIRVFAPFGWLFDAASGDVRRRATREERDRCAAGGWLVLDDRSCYVDACVVYQDQEARRG